MVTRRSLGILGVWVACATGCAVGTVGDDETGSVSQELQGQFCGGIAAFPCPDGYECVDDPRDGCDPALGGADCGGICRRAHCQKSYVGHSVEECAVIRFVCAAGTRYFSDRHGCGCTCDPSGDWCVYGGNRYHVGQSFPSTDGCNTCTCSTGGLVACTERACLAI